MNGDLRDYELKFDEIKKKLNELERIKKDKEKNEETNNDSNIDKNELFKSEVKEENSELFKSEDREENNELFKSENKEENNELFEFKDKETNNAKFKDLNNYVPNTDTVVNSQDELDKYLTDTNDIKNDSENKTNIKTKKTDIFMIILLFLCPLFIAMSVVCLHSTYLFRNPFNYIILGITIVLLILFIIKFIFKIKNKGKNAKHKRLTNIIFYIILSIYLIGCITSLFLLYGPKDNFRNWLITTAMRTKNHQYLCKIFYNNNEINYVLDNNYVLESGESTDASLVNKEEKVTYDNEYEEAILKRDKNANYKIIELNVNGCKGYLAAIYDPSKVKLAVTDHIGNYGQYVTTMAKNNNAILAINGGGFFDPGNSSNGGTPTGITISDGKIITNGQYGSNNQGGGIIGFNADNVLVLLKNTSAQQAINDGVRDAVSWGPFLIVNGTPSFIKGNGGWGYAARTAIGQRDDGIVLFLTVDSNATRTNGADMVDLTEIMQNYGAINAANLDGGTSTVMVMPKEQGINYNNKCADLYCYINDPIDGGLNHSTRAIADAWILTK